MRREGTGLSKITLSGYWDTPTIKSLRGKAYKLPEITV